MNFIKKILILSFAVNFVACSQNPEADQNQSESKAVVDFDVGEFAAGSAYSTLTCLQGMGDTLISDGSGLASSIGGIINWYWNMPGAILGNKEAEEIVLKGAETRDRLAAIPGALPKIFQAMPSALGGFYQEVLKMPADAQSKTLCAVVGHFVFAILTSPSSIAEIKNLSVAAVASKLKPAVTAVLPAGSVVVAQLAKATADVAAFFVKYPAIAAKYQNSQAFVSLLNVAENIAVTQGAILATIVDTVKASSVLRTARVLIADNNVIQITMRYDAVVAARTGIKDFAALAQNTLKYSQGIKFVKQPLLQTLAKEGEIVFYIEKSEKAAELIVPFIKSMATFKAI